MNESRRPNNMIRKQFYIAPEQQRKLRALAKRWQCTEAEVVRRALDRISAPADDSPEAILGAAGLLAPKREDPDLPSPGETADLERRFREWARTRTEPIGLSQAVMEDRR
jgi:hypothetical protein